MHVVHPRARTALRSRSLVVAIAAALASPAALAAGIHLNVGTLDTTQITRSSLAGTFDGKRLHLVQFEGPIKGEWVDALAADGLQVLDYLPDYAYLVYGDADALSRMQSRSARGPGTGIAWDGPWLAEYKIHPATWQDEKHADVPLALRAAATDRFSIQLVADPEANGATRARLSALGARVLGEPGAIPGRVNLNVELDPSALALIASHADVVSIHPYVEPVRFDERQNMIMAGELTGNAPTPGDYFTRLAAWGFTQAQFNASGFVVDVTDDGADRNPTGAAPGTIPQDANAGPVPANHFVLWESGDRPIGATTPTGTSRFVYKGRWGTASTGDGGQGLSGHGQLNMSIVGGYVPTGTVGGVNFGAFPHADASGFRFGLGVAPYVRLANSVIFDPGYTDPDFNAMLSAGYASGMRISSNSWGASVGGAYTTDAQTYDRLVRDTQAGTAGNQEAVIVFSAGNSGPGANTIGAPGTGKNVITVGAAENVHPFGGNDGCNIGDTGADNANDIIGFSSRGPTDDGRFKPDIQAPGTHITGMAYVTPDATGNGTSVTGFRNDGVCGGVAGGFMPTGQFWYTASSGTSHSAPAVAGALALVRQQFINNPSYLADNRTPAGSAPPSPAMSKAYLANSARYMTGVSANDTLPSQSQGMGMVNLGTAFDGTPRALRDQAPADLLGGTGETRSFAGTISDPKRPFRVTLAWTDAPGTTTGNSYVNDLDLVVRVGGETYRGNVFSGANSTTGGGPDRRNNIESVSIPAGVTGPFSVLVSGANIPGDGVPGNADTTDQDFALVAYNAASMTACPAIAVTAPTFPATVDFGSAFPDTILAASGGTAPYTYSASALPAGLSIVDDTLQGTPAEGGTFNVAITATDATGCIMVREFPLVVRAANLTRGDVAVTSGNNLLEPLECNTISVPLANGGDLGATAISATLTSTTPGVAIATGTSAYPNLAPAGSAANTTLFEVGTDGSVQCNTLVNFTQTVTYAGGVSPRVFNFTLPIGSTGLNYGFADGTGATIPAGGTLLAGSQADDATLTVPVPAGFSFQVYDTTVAGGSSIRVDTNGGILISTGTETIPFTNTTIPATGLPAGIPAILPYWDDLDLRTTEVAGGGIYTQVVGTAPNRQWIIEWRGRPFASGTPVAPEPVNLNFAVVFNEGSNAIEYRYVMAEPGGGSATVGVQASNAAPRFTLFSFNTPGSISAGQRLVGTLPPAQCSPGPGSCIVDVLFRHGFEPAPTTR